MNLLTKIRLIPVRFWGNIYFQKQAIWKAKRLHKENGKRYRVLFLNLRYRVMSSDDIDLNKRSGRFKKSLNSLDLNKHTFYDTIQGKNFVEPKLR